MDKAAVSKLEQVRLGLVKKNPTRVLIEATTKFIKSWNVVEEINASGAKDSRWNTAMAEATDSIPEIRLALRALGVKV